MQLLNKRIHIEHSNIYKICLKNEINLTSRQNESKRNFLNRMIHSVCTVTKKWSSVAQNARISRFYKSNIYSF